MSKNSNIILLFQHFSCLVLFTYQKVNIRKKKTSDKVWKRFHVQFEMWGPFLIWTKKKHFFLENCTLVWSERFSDNYLSIDLKIWNQVWKLNHKICWEKRYQLLLFSNDIHTFWFLIILWNMPKGLVT